MTKIKDLQAFELILRYWEENPCDDKFFIYNPYTSKIILGIGKCDDYINAPYVLYPMTFFTKANEEIGQVFNSYCIIEHGEIIYNSFKTLPSSGAKFLRKRHSLIKHDDNYAHWKRLFNVIEEHIAKKEFEKVVVARKISFECADGFDFPSIVLNLFEENINSYIFAYAKNGQVFFGASPELLIEKQQMHMKSYALAGTIKKLAHDVARQGQEFLKDEKNIYEHNIVINSIAKTMQSLGNNIQISPSHILELKNLLHIKTDICAQEFEPNQDHVGSEVVAKAHMQKSKFYSPTILKWVKKLHPTPALGGSPKQKALDFIEQYETFERGHFGAPFGVVDANGNGFFIVGIRSALIQSNILHAYAGCGIVAKSNCHEEYKEIDDKLRTIVEAL